MDTKKPRPAVSSLAAKQREPVADAPETGEGRLPGRAVTDPPVFPIVGIGASAGGLTAFEAFFSGMPEDRDPGMAFVLVQHLAPDHKSLLTALVQRYTRMRVFEVTDGMNVRANCAYIIPPNRDMALLNGSLQLFEPVTPHGQRLSIDFFFKSLAQDQRERAICIVLSGTGSDGTLGLRAVKAEGGMAMAQNPASTEFDGMPRSALATGLVDYELPPAEMPSQLMAYAAHAFGKLPKAAAALEPGSESAMRKIFVVLRAQTGHDFSLYKPNTLHRRIERRMAVQQIDSIDEYVKFLQQSKPELDALFRDLLIGVTNFFRDPEAFKALEENVIPRLFAGKPRGSTVRVWTPGCSTGEEAYSIAILMKEYIHRHSLDFKVQVFATDIDARAVAVARAGVYPASMAADLTPERLAKHFMPEPAADSGIPSAYRVRKSLRDDLIFSEQDMIKDPPFSKLDLISCRNLLIYMSAELQRKIMPLFHYALNPGGMLFLGTSETIGDSPDYFSTLDRKNKIYARKEFLSGAPHAAFSRMLSVPAGRDRLSPLREEKRPAVAGSSLREAAERAILQETAAAGAMVNAQGEILYVHGRTGMFLEPAPGEAGPSNILKMAREGLRSELGAALRKVAATGAAVRSPGLSVKTNGHFTSVDMVVRPVSAEQTAYAGTPMYLVLLSESAPRPGPSAAGAPTSPGVEEDALVLSLRRELKAQEDYLQAANEELETSNEELKSSNEEMQSVNEEMQSANEELETSKEELQSVNEELATVNVELQAKVADLTRVNNDMNNLMAGTGIGTVFVDHGLNIQRFTPAATRIINLIPSDIGRPVGHIVSNLVGYDSLLSDVRTVLETLVPKETEARTLAGAWYTIRIMPYRTLENVIEGVVITFVDITEAKRTQDALGEVESNFRMLVESLPHLVWTCGPDGQCDYFGPQWLKYTGAAPERQTGELWLDYVHPDDREALMLKWRKSIAAGESFDVAFRLRAPDSGYRGVDARVTALRGGGGKIVKWFGMDLDSAGAR